MTPGQEFIDDTRQRKHVIPRIGIQTFDHLRAGVGRRHCSQRTYVECGAVTRQLIWFGNGPRNPEVYDLDASIRQNNDVGWLQIRMDNSFQVRELQGSHDLPEYR